MFHDPHLWIDRLRKLTKQRYLSTRILFDTGLREMEQENVPPCASMLTAGDRV